MERLNPDVLAVQELGPRQAAALAEILPHGRLEPAAGARGMGIALRRPGPVVPIPLPYRGGWVASVMPAGAPTAADALEIVNVHLIAPHMWPPWRTLPVRRAQVRALEAYLDATPHPRRVVVGDLNATPLWPAYRRLARRLGDAAADAARREGRRPPRTWRPHPRVPCLLRIDHVLTVGLDARCVRVVPIPGSDHCAVVVDLSIDGR